MPPTSSQRLGTSDYLRKLTRILQLLAPPAALVAQYSQTAAMQSLLACLHLCLIIVEKGSVSPCLLAYLTIAIEFKQVHRW